MNASLYQELNHQLSPLASHVAQLLHVSPEQSQQAMQAVNAVTIHSLQRSAQMRGSEGAMQLLDVSALQNIPADAPMDDTLVWTARDTGRVLLDKYVQEGEPRQSVIAQLASQLGVDLQKSQDLLQTYLTLAVRALSIWVERQGLDAAQLQQYLQQDPMNDPAIPAWTRQFHQAQHQHALDRGDTPLAAAPTQPMPAPVLNAPPAASSRVADTAGQSSQEKQAKSLLSKYGLHLGFALLVLIPLLVFMKSCHSTEEEGRERMNTAPSAVDTGMNGEGQSVLPNPMNTDNPNNGSAPSAPAATEIVPHTGDPATTPMPTNTAVANDNTATATASSATNTAASTPVVIPGNTAADSDPNVATATAQ